MVGAVRKAAAQTYVQRGSVYFDGNNIVENEDGMDGEDWNYIGLKMFHPKSGGSITFQGNSDNDYTLWVYLDNDNYIELTENLSTGTAVWSCYGEVFKKKAGVNGDANPCTIK